MEFVKYSFRYAEDIMKTNCPQQLIEIFSTLQSITDQEIIDEYNSIHNDRQKSISSALNKIIKRKLISLGWNSESNIFLFDNDFTTNEKSSWRLDFAKDNIAIEVAFNHSGVIAWNLIKPVLSSELNHVKKAIQTDFGVIITATNDLKIKGGFDNSIGTYEKFIDYLEPLRNLLTVPILIIGLQAPQNFIIEDKKIKMRD